MRKRIRIAEQEQTPARVGKVVQQATVIFANDSLAFPLSLEEAGQPQVEGPSRFVRRTQTGAHGPWLDTGQADGAAGDPQTIDCELGNRRTD